MSYKILKIPVNREKVVFYYFKSYEPSKDSHDSSTLIDIPQDKAVYLCHFLRPIEEDFVNKFFGKVGKISQIFIGEYKNKACNKRKRRTIYYAIIIFKRASDAQSVLSDSKVMQTVVNSITRKQVKYLHTDGDSEEAASDHDDPEYQHRRQMTEGGFTLVAEGDDHLHSKKAKVSDGNHTTMVGIKREHAEKILKETLEKGKYVDGASEDEEEVAAAQLKRQKKVDNTALYGLNEKVQKKQELEKLREDFEKYKKQMAKVQANNRV